MVSTEPPSPEVRRALLPVRLALDSATREARPQGTAIERLRATLLLGFAIELSLSVILDDEIRDMAKAIGRLEKDVGHPLPSRREAMRAWKARTEAQHRGTLPSGDDLTSMTQGCKTFIEASIAAMFSIDLSSLSPSDELQTPALREAFRNSEAALDTNALGPAQDWAARGWSRLELLAEFAVEHAWGVQRPRDMWRSELSDIGEIQDHAGNLQDRLNAVEVSAAMGLNVAELARIRRALPSVSIFWGGVEDTRKGNPDGPNRETVQRMVTIGIDAGQVIEGQLPAVAQLDEATASRLVSLSGVPESMTCATGVTPRALPIAEL